MINELRKDPSSIVFLEPVDWRGLNIPNYPQIVKNPMDLHTLEENLKAQKYESLEAFLSDLDLIWANCKLFNQIGSPIYHTA